MTDNRQFRFGIFDFDAATLELRKAQHPVRLRPQSLKLLRLLVSRPRQLISREEIHKELWGADVFVDFEQGVNHSVKQLRAALGDDADEPRYIETLPRRGYRFIAPVELFSEVEDPAFRQPRRPPCAIARHARWCQGMGIDHRDVRGRLTVLLFFVFVRARNSPPFTLAVLPFDVVAMPPESHYLGVSLADAVIARLAAGREVRVRPTTAIVGHTTEARGFRGGRAEAASRLHSCEQRAETW